MTDSKSQIRSETAAGVVNNDLSLLSVNSNNSNSAVTCKTKDPRTYHWVDDDLILNCQSCDTLFSIRKRKHHCRQCGRVFCAVCTSTKIQLPVMGYLSLVRVCRDCAVHSAVFATRELEEDIDVKEQMNLSLKSALDVKVKLLNRLITQLGDSYDTTCDKLDSFVELITEDLLKTGNLSNIIENHKKEIQRDASEEEHENEDESMMVDDIIKRNNVCIDSIVSLLKSLAIENRTLSDNLEHREAEFQHQVKLLEYFSPLPLKVEVLNDQINKKDDELQQLRTKFSNLRKEVFEKDKIISDLEKKQNSLSMQKKIKKIRAKKNNEHCSPGQSFVVALAQRSESDTHDPIPSTRSIRNDPKSRLDENRSSQISRDRNICHYTFVSVFWTAFLFVVCLPWLLLKSLLGCFCSVDSPRNQKKEPLQNLSSSSTTAMSTGRSTRDDYGPLSYQSSPGGLQTLLEGATSERRAGGGCCRRRRKG